GSRPGSRSAEVDVADERSGRRGGRAVGHVAAPGTGDGRTASLLDRGWGTSPPGRASDTSRASAVLGAADALGEAGRSGRPGALSVADALRTPGASTVAGVLGDAGALVDAGP